MIITFDDLYAPFRGSATEAAYMYVRTDNRRMSIAGLGMAYYLVECWVDDGHKVMLLEECL